VNHDTKDIRLVQMMQVNEAVISLVSFNTKNITLLPESLLNDRAKAATAILTPC
jgi:hypothetical protein